MPTSNLPAALIDRFDRKIDYLRLSVMDRCDLRCHYCLPKGFRDFAEPAEWLNFDEITRVAKIFGELGVRRLRLTGGEPLLRKNLSRLVRSIRDLQLFDDISLSTNATQLTQQAHELYEAGVSRLNISLDSLDPSMVQAITGRDSLQSVMAGLDAAVATGFSPIKINMVVMAENMHEVPAMTEFCIKRGFVLRLIEAMPMGVTGAAAEFINLSVLRERLVSQFNLIAQPTHVGGGPAQYWQTADGKGSLGFITPKSQHFCNTCNRVRLSTEGTLYLCLGQNDKVELGSLMREGASDNELRAAIVSGISMKPEHHEFNEKPQQVLRFMSKTGG
ncbi:GTP 3',8-cyclase [Formosimonas limnophila]|uniref:GTP 3',8-cyclase n=1 Tax=Formosimonas limnophila TaxID=1384487 RepID=A0A8J3CKP9_9BURK|nr:GTP 3',8-cyclase MoaA [Formosimonas limnophila]GHA70196.1 GTP 3',8-cyclase [Formosimonas limnophila]